MRGAEMEGCRTEEKENDYNGVQKRISNIILFNHRFCKTTTHK